MSALAAATPVSIALVEDDPHVRDGIARALSDEPCWRLRWVAAGLAEARTRGFDGIDLLLLDVGLPDGNGLDLLDDGVPPTLVISAMGDEHTVLRALQHGAAGYLLKDAPQQDLQECIRAVLDGGAPITPSVAVHILRRMRRDETQPTSAATGLDRLTPREADVLRTLARGYRYEEAAQLLGISRHTVGHHVKQIYGKLAVGSRSEAVFEAIRAGWLTSRGD